MTINQVFVSIIIPVFNRRDLISETLESVLAQHYSYWECIIVDDGSTDNSNSICKAYAKKDDRFKCLKRDREPKGAPVCRNIGLQHAKGEYLIFLDSDDVLAPGCLQQRVELFEQNVGCDFLVFNGLLFDENTSHPTHFWNVSNAESDIDRFLKLDAVWQTTGPVYRKSFLQSLNGFREDLPFWQDYDLHIRSLFAKGQYKKYFDTPDFYIRKGRNDTISRRIGFVEKLDVLRIRTKYFFELFKSFQTCSLSNQPSAMISARSMLFFLCSQYLIKHSRFLEFITNWLKFSELAALTFSEKVNCWRFLLLLKLGFRFPKLKQKAKEFAAKHALAMPDYFIMDNNKVTIVPFHNVLIKVTDLDG